MHRELLKEYVRSILSEKYFLRSYDFGDFKSGGILKKLKGAIFGSSGSKIAADWIEDAESMYDISIDDKIKREIEDYVSKKYPVALKKSRGDEDRAKSMMKRALDFQYLKKIRSIDKEEL